MKRAIAVRHVSFEDLGTLGPLLRRRGFSVSYHDAGIDSFRALNDEAIDLLVVLGGPIGASDEGAYPFLSEELALIDRRLVACRPTLGVCLGAQLMARAAGATVKPMGGREIGFGPVRLTQAGRSSALSALRDDVHVLHWHGDMFEMQRCATLLAATAACPHQAFEMGRQALALQFHLEVDPGSIERWLIGHAVELSLAAVAPESIREQARQHSEALRFASTVVFESWLDRIERRD